MVVRNLRPAAAEFDDKGEPRIHFLNLLSFRYPENVVSDGNSCCVCHASYFAAQKFDRRLSFEIASDVFAALV